MRTRRPVIWVALGWASCVAVSVPSAFAAPETGTFDHWDVRDGLPQASVHDFSQSPDGSMWLATSGGLVRFDGYTFTVFDRARLPGLEAVRFTRLEPADDGNLWVGSERGLFLVRALHAEALGPRRPVVDLAKDAEGHLVVAYEGGLFRVVDGQVEPLDSPESVQKLFLHAGSIYGTHWGGAHTCLIGPCPPLPEAPPVPGVHEWLHAPDGRLLVATGRGLFIREDDQWSSLFTVPHDDTRIPTCRVWQDELWCAVGERALPISALEGRSLDHARFRATRMGVDREGGLWLGTDGSGMTRLGLPSHDYLGRGWPVTDVATGPDGSLFVGVRDVQGPVPLPWTSGAAFWQEAPESILVFSRGELMRFDGLGTRPITHRGDLRFGRTPVEGPWLTVGGTLYRVQGEETHAVVEAAQLGARSLRPIRGDSESVWLVADEAELVFWRDGGPQARYDITPWALVRDVVLRERVVLVATYGTGLVVIPRSQPRRARAYPSPAGGCDDFVSHLFVFPEELWMNTNRGLGRVTAAALDVVPARIDCRLAGTEEANGAQGIITAEGAIVAPTLRGAVRLHPSRFSDGPPPLARAESWSHRGERLRSGFHLEGPETFHLELSAAYFENPHVVSFRHRLLGHSEEWSKPSTSRSLEYPDLGPGVYRFEVQARGFGDWGPVDGLGFIRDPAWWERPLLRIGFPVAVALGAIFLLAVSLRRARRRSARLAEEVSRRASAQAALEEQLDAHIALSGQLEAARRLEGLGRLSGGVAHDFNNLLTVVRAHASMLEDHPDEEVRSEAEGLHDVVDRGISVAKGLLQFGRSVSGNHFVDLSERSRELIPLLRRLIRREIALELHAAPESHVGLLPGHVDQVVTNLVLNARDAIADRGRVKIAVRRTAAEVVLSVEDDGAGMTEEQRTRALEPYFSTKPMGQGTGLGLSSVHGILSAADGQIDIESTPGEGTVVRITLPLVEPRVESDESPPAPLPSAGLRVLVIDDREEVRRALRLALRKLGWTGSVVGTLLEAEAVLRESPVDLLISDVVMPEMSGPEVRARLQQIQPELPTLFLSGHVSSELSGVTANEVVLAKPFDAPALARAAARVLDPNPAAPSSSDAEPTQPPVG